VGQLSLASLESLHLPDSHNLLEHQYSPEVRLVLFLGTLEPPEIPLFRIIHDALDILGDL
jgi:hypothetical protein